MFVKIKHHVEHPDSFQILLVLVTFSHTYTQTHTNGNLHQAGRGVEEVKKDAL